MISQNMRNLWFPNMNSLTHLGLESFFTSVCLYDALRNIAAIRHEFTNLFQENCWLGSTTPINFNVIKH